MWMGASLRFERGLRMSPAFVVLAPIMVVAALAMLFVRKAVHAALLLAVVMISLAVLYAVLEAPFLFVVQIIVYTGAILMLFLFVVMLVGVDASDSVVETIRGQRVLAILGGLLLGTVLVVGLSQLTLGSTVGLEAANSGGNIQGLANILFSRYVFAFEVTSALLITAAVGAMVLAHRERLTPKPGQAEIARRKLRDYAETGAHPGPLPPPGVYARHNAVDTPALLPDGTPAEVSVSRVLAARGVVRSAPALADDIEEVQRQLGVEPDSMPETSGKQGAPASTEEDERDTAERSSDERRPGDPA
jgi:NADH-quinone oxidoreductase subunit J